MVVAWFAVSNHCALLSLQTKLVKSECCHPASAGTPDDPALPKSVCCKLLRAVPIESGAKFVAVTHAHMLFDLAWEIWVSSALVEASTDADGETTRPPRADSFAELVLQRSLRGNAPPFLS